MPDVRPPPDLGADTRAILKEILDLDASAVEQLLRAGIVFGPDEANPRRIVPETLR